MNRTIFSVRQINDYVRSLMHRDPVLNEVWIRGEISNLKVHSSGHMYFTLKDEHAQISCVMFRQDRDKLDFIPSNGMRVIIKGQVSLYCKAGQYQLYTYHMEPDGVGALHVAFEALKYKLEQEGLFDKDTKKAIPTFPKKVAVITSHTGAAVRDIINIIKRRNKAINILVIPVLVQGVNAPTQISAALDYVNTREDIDVIIIGRGGGSIEELWAFNEEIVAKAIWRSTIPVISAVGHETDITIADLVADLRASTPSAAAEIVAPDMSHYRQIVATLTKRLHDSICGCLSIKRKRIDIIKNSYVLKYPDRLINYYGIELDKLSSRLISSVTEDIRHNKERLASLSSYLDALSPLKVLERGYAVVTDKMGKVIHSITQVKKNDSIDVRLYDGLIGCNVVKIKKEQQIKK
ncbi:MAG TPA: exodeoxyribonuclease VII large subunit [Clostridiales bacterium]|nr:exodeoxyribonuclease VII large subunit [Clostridiales bacterium]